MSLILAYSRDPFAAAEECEALGIETIIPRHVELIRQGKRRRPDTIITPAWPRYVFADITPDQWHWLADTKHCRTLMWVADREAQLVRKAANAIERAFSDRMAAIEAGERIWHFTPGDILDIVGGAWAGQVATFIRMAEAGDKVTVHGETIIFGRETPIELDPLQVRKAVG